MAGGKKLRVAMIGQKTILSRKGGVEVVVKELSERMVKQGITVTCYNRREKGEKRPKTYNGIKMKYAWTIRAKGLAALTSSFFATIMILFSKNNVVHYHAEGPCAWMWIIKLFSRKRIIATIHGLDWQRNKWGKIAARWIKKGEKTAAKYADVIIVLNKSTKEYFQEEYNRETIFVPNGVVEPKIAKADLIERNYGLSKDNYILYLARITPEKGIKYLIEAYQKVKTKKKLVIAGGSDDAETFYDEIKKEVQDNSNILLLGFVDGEVLAELYSNAFLYVLPSDLEGMPLSLLEAMSYGNCCITSNIEECSSVLGGNGLLFKKSNALDLCSCIKKALQNKEIVQEKRKKAQKYILDKYNWNDVVNETARIYLGELR